MIDKVEKEFDQALTDRFFAKPEVLKFLIQHERKPVCLNNLCEQIKICERRTYKITFEIQEYKMVIRDVAMMFASQALRLAEEKAMSSLERIRREEKNRHLERAKETIQEYEGGIFKEIIGD